MEGATTHQHLALVTPLGVAGIGWQTACDPTEGHLPSASLATAWFTRAAQEFVASALRVSPAAEAPRPESTCEDNMAMVDAKVVSDTGDDPCQRCLVLRLLGVRVRLFSAQAWEERDYCFDEPLGRRLPHPRVFSLQGTASCSWHAWTDPFSQPLGQSGSPA